MRVQPGWLLELLSSDNLRGNSGCGASHRQEGSVSRRGREILVDVGDGACTGVLCRPGGAQQERTAGGEWRRRQVRKPLSSLQGKA